MTIETTITEVATIETTSTEVATIEEPELSGLAPDAMEAFKEVLKETGGERLAPALVEAAEDPDSPLHRYFEWNDSTAAIGYRLVQAEMIIRRIKVRLLPPKKTSPIRVRALVSGHDLGGATGSYVQVTEVAHDAALKAAMLDTLTRELTELYEKYSDHADLFEEALTRAGITFSTT